ncbi:MULTISPECIES: helix-turn-helix domain-containing protein [Flavobacterium]|uniref:helix-turn-helix domain-containing protein n=1 Tax=Flavobacterium TaxID=237 RepID=UPI000B4D0F15|nr:MULTISPECIES: helix-turn-helix transcriptional regulator [Flavobacterium]OWP80755.1 hypothetical protein BWK63_09265 [Flavobacterium covae]POR21539.1 hypothetical protein BWK58_12225 [Flavobacterium columnare]POR22214.1 hypothetical protein BWK57_06985 [Flavobacterium columnare]
MAKWSIKPSIELQPYIDRYFYDDNTYHNKDPFPFFLPGTGLDLFFHFGDNIFDLKPELGDSYLICPRQILGKKSVPKGEFIAVRFKSGMFRHFSTIPYYEITNQFLTAEDIWGNDFKEFQKIFLDEEAISGKIKLIESFLIQLLFNFKKQEIVNWDYFNQKIYEEYRDIRITDLSDYSSFSKRTFERNFKESFGVSPKVFQKLVRLEKTIKSIHLSEGNLIDSLEFGYYDQSHFNKDFKEFIGMTPKEYFNKNNVHYYFESLK